MGVKEMSKEECRLPLAFLMFTFFSLLNSVILIIYINLKFTELRSPQSFYNSMPLNLSIDYI